jgi:hypothetical protein
MEDVFHFLRNQLMMRLINPIFFSGTTGLILTTIFTIVWRFMKAICLHELVQYFLLLRLYLKDKPQCRQYFVFSMLMILFYV